MNKTAVDFELMENEAGCLCLQREAQAPCVVMPVLAFPLSDPQTGGLSLVDEHGKEVAWLPSLDVLSDTQQLLLKSHVARREFRPIIQHILSVSVFSTPSTWRVQTEGGLCEFVLKSEESIRNLGQNKLLLTHQNGMQFLIPDLSELDRKSRQFLARFMA